MKKITLLLLMLLTINCSFAQINYTNIPDTTLIPTQMWDPPQGIDFDNDGTLEITTFDGVMLELFDPTFTFETCKIWANGTVASGWDDVASILPNTTIDSNGNFITSGDASMDRWGAGTLFPLNDDAYLAVKINWGGNTHYGWVRIMWNGTNFIYKDYAYNTTPNEAINAGQQVLAIEEYNNTMTVSYYPNPTRNFVSIKSEQTIEEAYLIDILGKTTPVNVFNNKINIAAFPSGVYFLHARAGKNTAIKKIIKL